MANGSGRRNSKSPTFLFINRDASTIARSGKDLDIDRAIQSHVQRGVRRKMKMAQEEANRKRGHLSPGHDDSKVSHNSIPEAETHDQERIISFREDAYQDSENGLAFWADSATGTDFGDPFFTNFVSTSASLSPLSQLFHSRTPSPLQGFSLDQLNPSIAPSPSSYDLITRHAPTLLHYWTNALLPERFPFDMRCTKLGRTRHAAAIHAEIQEVAAQPAHLYSVISAIAVQVLVRNGSLHISDMVRFEEIGMVVHLRAQAEQTVQSSLRSGNIDLNMCRSLQYLTLIAFLTDMPEAAATHFGTMMKVVDILGGLPAFDSYFIESEIINHWYGALRTLKKPAINLWSVVAEPAEVSRFRSRHSSSNHGVPRSGHPAIGVAGQGTGQCSPAMAAILQDLSTALDFAQWLQTQSPESYSAEHCKWVSLQHLSAGYRLLELQAANPSEEVMRIAAIYFVALTRGKMDQRCAATSVGKLREALQNLVSLRTGMSDAEAQGQEYGSAWMLWAVVVGALAAEGTRGQGWFVDVVVETARKARVHSLHGLERHLESIVYDRCSIGALVGDFWHRHLAVALRI